MTALTTLLAGTQLTWKVDGSFHYVDLMPFESGPVPYRIVVREDSPSSWGKPEDPTYYKISFGVFCNSRRFYDLEVAKKEAVNFAARVLLEALCNLNPEITAPFNADIDFAFLGIDPKTIEEDALTPVGLDVFKPGWKVAPIAQANFPRAKKALELAGFEVTDGTNAEKQQWIWWRAKQ
jgi:hypothetical protein